MNTNRLTRAIAIAGLSSFLLVSGCASPSAQTETESPSVTADSAAQSTSTAPASPTVTSAPATAPASESSTSGFVAQKTNESPYANGLVLDTFDVKAGTDLILTGGQYSPGVTVKIYGAEQVTAVYDAATDSYKEASPEVRLTEEISVVTNEDGQFKAKLPVPANTKPQLMNVIAFGDDNSGFGVQAEVK